MRSDLLDVLRIAADPQRWADGSTLAAAVRFRSTSPTVARAYCRANRTAMTYRVKITADAAGVRAACSCGDQVTVCPHVVATGIAWHRESTRPQRPQRAAQPRLPRQVVPVPNRLGPAFAPCAQWRTQVRIVTPATADGVWPVTSALVAADGRAVALHATSTLHPTEAILAARHARTAVAALRQVCPELATGQAAAGLDAEAVLALIDARDDLAASGVDLALPANLRRLGAAQVEMTAEVESTGRFGLDSLCGFTYDVVADGVQLTDAEVAAIAAARNRFVPTEDGWLLLSGTQVAALTRLLNGRNVADVLAAGDHDAEDVAVEAVNADGWLAQLLDSDGPSDVEAVELGPLFLGQLHDYQSEAVNRIAFLGAHGLGALLFDEMGLGKTVYGLALCCAAIHAGITAPTLVVVPKVMVRRWAEEAERFCPDVAVAVLHGNNRQTAAEAVDAGAQIVVVSHAGVRNAVEAFAEVDWHRVIVDEAHVAKNDQTQLHRALRRLACTQMVVATGTPVQNGLEDLHSVVSVAIPGLLGSAEEFRARYARPIRDGGPGAELLAEQLLDRIQPFMLARTKADVGLDRDLPPIDTEDVVLALTAEQAAMSQASADAAREAVENAESRFAAMSEILRAIMRAKQIANHPENYLQAGGELIGRSAKLDATIDIVGRAVAAGDRTLIFTQSRVMGGLLQRALGAVFGADRVGFLSGETSTDDRAGFADQLTDGTLDVLVVTVMAGGVGLTLTGANWVVHYDRWWNPAIEDQATARAHRIGQTKPVHVFRLMCEASIETAIDACISDKRQIAARLFGVNGDATVARQLSHLDTAELTRVLAGAA